MSILIQGMEMPKQGRVTLQIGADGAVYVVDKCEITAEKYEKNFEVLEVPSEDIQPVTHCKDCVYRPYYEPSDSKSASDLVFPDYRFNLCPCRVEDFWYSWMPDDDWFCAYGKRKDGEA